MLQAVKHGFHFIQFKGVFIVLIQQSGVDFLQRAGDIAPFVHCIHQGMGNGLVPFTEGRQIELPFQVILKRFGRGITGFEIVIVFVVVAGCRRWCGLVDVVPGGINRQIVRNVVRNLVLRGPVRAVLGFIPVAGRFRGSFSGGLGGVGLALVVFAGCVGLVIVLGGLQHGVGFQCLLDFLLEVESGELEKPDRLLQLGRHGQALTQL